MSIVERLIHLKEIIGEHQAISILNKVRQTYGVHEYKVNEQLNIDNDALLFELLLLLTVKTLGFKKTQELLF